MKTCGDADHRAWAQGESVTADDALELLSDEGRMHGDAMVLDRVDPVSYALTVARSVLKLIDDVASDGGLPKPMASAMARVTTIAHAGLSRFLSMRSQSLKGDLGRAIDYCRVDMEAMVQLLDLVISHDLTRRNADHVATAIRCTANGIMERLSYVEHAIEQ